MTKQEVDEAWELATRDDCLNRMIPSDVRRLVAEIMWLREGLGLIAGGDGEATEIARQTLDHIKP